MIIIGSVVRLRETLGSLSARTGDNDYEMSIAPRVDETG